LHAERNSTRQPVLIEPGDVKQISHFCHPTLSPVSHRELNEGSKKSRSSKLHLTSIPPMEVGLFYSHSKVIYVTQKSLMKQHSRRPGTSTEYDLTRLIQPSVRPCSVPGPRPPPWFLL
jgi:hypothetical protein